MRITTSVASGGPVGLYVSSSGSASTAYGIKVEVSNATNKVGLLLGNVVPGGSYDVYASNTGSNNYFGGAVSIGTTGISSLLTVADDIYANSNRIGTGPGNVASNFVFATYASPVNKTGAGLVLIGKEAGNAITSGHEIVAIGENAAKFLDTSINIVAIGKDALGTANAAGNNHGIAIGPSCLQGASGAGNNAMGFQTGSDVRAGTYNTLIGHNTGRGIVTGGKNTIVGAQVVGLSSGLANNIILADGDGVVRLQSDSSGYITIGQKLIMDASTATGSPFTMTTMKGKSTAFSTNFFDFQNESAVSSGKLTLTSTNLLLSSLNSLNLTLSGSGTLILDTSANKPLTVQQNGTITLFNNAADASSPTEGSIWYRTDTDILRLRKVSTSVDVMTSDTDKVLVVRDIVLYTNNVTGTGVIDMGFYRVPAQLNGYAFAGASYSLFTAGAGAATSMVVATRRINTSTNLHSGQFDPGDVIKDISGTGITVSTGDFLKLNVISNTFSTAAVGLTVTYIFSPS